MGLHLSVFTCVSVFVACSTAVSSSAFTASGSRVSSTASGDFTKTVTTSASSPRVTNHEPCFLASSAVASLSSLSPSAPHPTIPAEIAYNCLKSVPMVKKDALQLVTNLAPYFEFQSTIGFLKDPPSGYLLPGIDLMGGLAQIESHVRDGVYTSEYDFGLDVFTLVASAHDGHFSYLPDIFGGVFKFQRTQSLVSISNDGLNLPKIYLQEDLLQSKNGSYSPSSVVSIDGKDAVAFLQDWGFGAVQAQDPDAAYNSLFYSLAGESAVLNPPFFHFAELYPGPKTTFSFENGTTKSFPNVARVLKDLKGITSGKDLYTKILDSEVSATPSSSSTATESETPLPTGYPLPVVKHSSNLISGFFLEDSVNKDVAVLSIPSFYSTTRAEIQEFQRILQEFLAQAKKSKKTKLIIDLQANPGGSVSLAIELFAQLFPTLPAYGGHNIRSNKANEVLGQIVSGLNTSSQAYKIDLDFNVTANPDAIIVSTPYNYRQDVLPDGSATYDSWSEVLGPVVTSHDNLTKVVRSNYSDPLWVDVGGLIITGTGNRTGFTQPFAAEDIVILSDGFCASTCALFSEFMKNQVGVSTIAAGGRPQYGPMQGVGGVKGAQVQEFKILSVGLMLAYLQAPPDLLLQFNNTFLGDMTAYPLNRSASASFNFLNNIRRGDTSFTPLQFVYEAADCRFFYTAEMLANVSSVWTRVANMAFGSSSSAQQDWARNPLCVRGSTGHRSSVSGGGPNNTDYAGSAPPAGARGQGQMPLLPDGTRMGWRLDSPAATNGSTTSGNGSYTGGASPLPASSSTAPRRAAGNFHIGKTLIAGLGIFVCFTLY